jgi:hypothetical protein
MMMKCFISLVLGLFLCEGHAVIHSNLKETHKAIIKLENIYKDICTGTVIGLNPPTVVTARHCYEMGNVNYLGISPNKVVFDSFDGVYFHVPSARLPGDLAILIFPRSSESEFRKDMGKEDLFVVEDVPLKNWDEVEICGYGGTNPLGHVISGFGIQRCGKSSLIVNDNKYNYPKEFDQVKLLNPGLFFPDYYVSMKAKYTYSLIQIYLQEYGSGTRLGIGALLPDQSFSFGAYDERGEKSLTHQGDSGGPVFIRKEGKNILVAVSSGMLGANLGSGSVNVGAFSWRLDHSWSKKLFKKAFNLGADVPYVE